MQGHMSKPITDKEALEIARLAEDEQVYLHRSSKTLRVATPKGDVRKMDYEEANRLAVYIGFVPTPHSSYLA